MTHDIISPSAPITSKDTAFNNSYCVLGAGELSQLVPYWLSSGKACRIIQVGRALRWSCFGSNMFLKMLLSAFFNLGSPVTISSVSSPPNTVRKRHRDYQGQNFSDAFSRSASYFSKLIELFSHQLQKKQLILMGPDCRAFWQFCYQFTASAKGATYIVKLGQWSVDWWSKGQYKGW